jgi:serine/threonine protein kinase
MLKTKRYGEYKIIDLIGKGGYGNVYLAQKGDIQYAIKCIDKDKIIEDNLEESIKTEISLMRMIRHPYIVKMSNAMTTQQKIMLVMEYVKGGDLFEYIVSQPDKKLSEDQSRLFFQQMIMALEYCHSLKIVHRDLKPENILIDKENNCIKISDFGLSTMLKHNDEMIQNACGTPNYLAPEVMKQTGGYLGQAADIWSAGVILYNMATGKNPFHHSDQNILLKNILSGNAEYPKTLSKPLADLLSKIFVPQPRNRYTIDQIKEHPWFVENFKPVIGYLKKETANDNMIKLDDEDILDSPKKGKKGTLSRRLIIDIENIPV